MQPFHLFLVVIPRHFLGRQQQPSDRQAWGELKEHTIPGLDAMRASATGELAAILGDVDLLREVFLQDAVLKLQEHGEAYKQHFPQLQRIVQHSCWESFAEQVRQEHARSLEMAHPDADRRATVQAARDEVRQCFKEISNVVQSASQPAVLPVLKKRPADDDLEDLQQPHKQQRSSAVFEWTLAGKTSLREVWSDYQRISAILDKQRSWAGTKRERGASSTAFNRFKDGLAAEISWRIKQGDCEESALAAIEQKLQGLPASKHFTPLQKLNEMYRKRRAA